MKLPPLQICRQRSWNVVIRNALTSRLAEWVGLACLIATYLAGATARADALQNWTVRQIPPPEGPWLVGHWDVTYGNGMFVAVGHKQWSDYGTIYSSPDGVNWSPWHDADPALTVNGELRRVIFANGKFLAVGWGNATYISQDGTNWTGFANGPGFGNFQDVCFGQGKYVAIDGANPELTKSILTSSDGRIWRRQAFARGTCRIGFGGGRFVVACQSFTGTTTSFYWSSNGDNWFRVEIDFALTPTGLTWGNGMFVVVGTKLGTPYTPTILTSPDGASWIPQNPGVTNLLSSVECINGLFVATGDSVILTSTNGVNWDTRTITNNLARFAYGNGTLLGISGNSFWGQDLVQSDPLLHLAVARENPSELGISGIQGTTIQIESASDPSGPWQVLDTFPLSTSPYLWTDSASPQPPLRFYRANWSP